MPMPIFSQIQPPASQEEPSVAILRVARAAPLPEEPTRPLPESTFRPASELMAECLIEADPACQSRVFIP